MANLNVGLELNFRWVPPAAACQDEVATSTGRGLLTPSSRSRGDALSTSPSSTSVL